MVPGASGRRSRRREALEDARPTRIELLAHLIHAVTACVEPAVLELDTSAFGAFGDESNFDLRQEIGVVGPLPGRLPGGDQSGGRVPHQPLAPIALGAVDVPLVPAAPLVAL